MIWKRPIYLFMCLILFVKPCRSQDHVTSQNLENYLYDQLEHTTQELTNLLDQSTNMENVQTDIKFYATKPMILPHNDTTANIFCLFHNTYVLIGTQLYYFVLQNNDTFALHEYIGFPAIQQKLLFIRAVEYGNLGLVLIAFPSGYSHVYGYFNSTNEWFLVQSISNEKVASDAKFFINKNRIFLVITNTMEHSLTASVIYKWTNAYFDVVDTVLTKNASSILSFQNRESEIIVITQTFLSNQQPNIAVYEFNNDHLRKIQLMLVKAPNHIVTYTLQDRPYLVIFEEMHRSTLYWWNGHELVGLMEFSSYKGVHQALTVNINKNLIIFLMQENYLLAFSHSQERLKLISKIQLNGTFSKIIDMKLISHLDLNTLLLFMVTNNKLSYVTIKFDIFADEIVSKPQTAEVLLQCLTDLEENVDTNNYHLNTLSEASVTIIQTNEPLEYSGRIDAGSAHAEAVKINSQFTLTEFDHNSVLFKNDLNNLEARLNQLNPQLNSLFAEDSVISGKLAIAGWLFAEQLQTKNLHLKSLNGLRWNPDVWLTYSKHETITGTVLFKNLVVKNLNIPDQYNIFNDIIHQSVYQNVTNMEVLNGLTANNIYTAKINNIPFENVYLRTEPVMIRGLKSFDKVAVNRMQTNYLNERNALEALQPLTRLQSHVLEFASDMKIKNFNFEEINGVNWKNLVDSAFRHGVTKQIEGKLTSAVIKSDKLYAKSISNIDTDALFTTNTDQLITASLHLRSVHAGNVFCNRINDIDLEKEAVRDDNNYVKGPVSINNIHVRGDLIVSGTTDDASIQGDHIIGTNETDLLHIYNKKVKIIGNLIVNNIAVSDLTKVLVNTKEYNYNVGNNYWSKNQNQVIPVFFEAQLGISAPHLLSSLLNNIRINDYVVNNLEDKVSTNLVFENATILGNVIINQTASHFPDLQKLDLESVKITGSYNITGHKTIQASIRIGNLITDYLDEIKVSDTVSSVNLDNISGIKTFENLVVSKTAVSNAISTKMLNNIPLKALVDKALFIDQPGSVIVMNIFDVTAHNIHTSYINTINFYEYARYLDGIYETKTLNNVLVNGNVQINSAQQVTSINNYDINNLPVNIISEDGSVLLQNNIKFRGNVYAENVEVMYINNINFPHLIQRLLYRDWDQNITAPYTFDKITTSNVFIPQLNDIPTRNLVNTKDPNPQNLLVWGGLQLASPKFLKSVSAETLMCNIKTAVANIKNPPTRYWNTVHVSQNISLWDDYSDLSIILKDTVCSSGNNIFISQVVFQHHISANTVYLQKLVNGIDLNQILGDAVLKDVNEQVVTGHKRFGHLATSSAFVEGNCHIPVINKLDIAKINNSIVCKYDVHDSIIRGSKVLFGGLQANRLISNTISDLNPQVLVSLAALHQIPEAYFQTLEVENDFNVAYVNDINMFERLSQRFLRYSPATQRASGTYYFDNAVLIGHSNISAINDLIVEDIVFDSDFQVISGIKSFVQDVVIINDISVDFMNEENLLNNYQQAILHGENNAIEGNIKFDDTCSITNNIETKSINGIAIAHVIEYMESKTPVIQTEIVNNVIKEIENVIRTSFEMSIDMPDKYLYLENSNELQISISHALEAHALEIKDNVMIHVLRQEEASVCGLPSTCSCPVQETIELTPELSVNTIVEFGIQRVFTYEDQDMSIHLFTNSVSSSNICRANYTIVQNESSSLMWMTYSPSKLGNQYFNQNYLTGYISGVEYFHSNGNVYMVVSRYYDPVNNTHNLDCLVYKFSKEKMQIELIQMMKTERAWTLYLFYTAQGITLVIGSISGSAKLNHNSGAEIYRFNETLEQFMLLRKVASTGCISAVGVVLGSDSLLVLAQLNSPLQVLKYHPRYDNYYFYQSIFLNYPVTGLSVFYTGDFGISDPLLCIATESGNFYVYSFQYIQGWHIVSSGEIDGLHALVPFVLNHKHYLFALTTKYSTLVTVIKHGSN